METTMMKNTKMSKREGLNRTMQYGNEKVKKAKDIQTSGLNRTMQYGN